MFKKIKKRDGKIVKFDLEKICQAITKAGQATGEFDDKMAKKLASKVLMLAENILGNKVPEVEEIQDIVEDVLLNSMYKKTAKAFVVYRDQHNQIRDLNDTANVGLMDQYLDKLDWQVNENSNMTFSLQGLNHYVSSEISKVYWLNKIYPKDIRQAYLEGDFHIHDLFSLSVYCVGWDLQDLLTVGWGGVSSKIESRPPKRFRSALGQITNFFYTMAGEAAGAQAFSNFDTLLAPFIRYSKLTYEEVKLALQEFMFNMNVPTRVGFQTPFTNVTFDLMVPSTFKDQPVIIGGKQQKETYGEFQKEMDILNKAFFEVVTEGDAKGRVFSWPIPTYNIYKGFDWNNKRFDGIWEMAAKYGIPYFSNFINSDMKPEDARSMCCRLRIDNRQLEKRGGGLFGANPLTGSVGVVTINLPRIGYLAKNEKDFFARLENLMVLAKNSLEIKRKVLEKFTDKNLYPYAKYYLRNMKARHGQYWKNHFATVGIVGMNEALLNLLGEDIGSKKGREFSLKVMDFMRDKLVKFQKETGNNYNLEATPAEGTAYRLALKDKELYPKIICANEKDYKKLKAAPYYTNSTQLPVNYTDDMFEALDLQEELQVKYTGGTVVHLFLGERIDNPQSAKQMVKKICEGYRLPYFTFSPTFSVCRTHGYLSGEHFECPKCGDQCEVYARVVGYLSPVRQWHKGKREEFNNRKMFNLPNLQACSGDKISKKK
ncbi:MAG: ribonucleoside triphosphate reductase [Candidatus Magasanikbacteria bacterium CG10_big_fil_rev_8_21_14_0_10_36_32]|uniref:Ribonucleoside triphosphate reductase n=1 Tax=Candidatus Magasanikbacteria bacterium CG10_big_fil_rev_8_21_14_0_10_36_32 TaxID=1974646 RepID=A0A2M6W756_9BACT|nr:MAG: ribonucleoside triphosphate reductase [Candidatus Magasanikbacteria bacterium CG10_big_fil_rev_8_21_14_0_10_36_32]